MSNKKVELHLHLDGSLNLNKAEELFGYNPKKQMVSKKDKNLGEYLSKFKLPIDLLQTKENLEEFSYLLAKDLKEDNVIYAEVRFCPLFHTKYINASEVIEAILKGLNKEKEVKTNLILCMMRHFEEEKNIEIINLAKKYLNKGVVAVDLAGDESKYKTGSFKKLFEILKSEKIPFTIHAGEADDYNSVIDAIEMGAERIGHGVRIIENEDAIKKVIQNKVTLEICPNSNTDTGIYNSIKDHPVKKLFDKGVMITINTDNRTVSDITLDKEYEDLKKELFFTEEEILKCNINAINAAFITEEEKELLKRKLNE